MYEWEKCLPDKRIPFKLNPRDSKLYKKQINVTDGPGPAAYDVHSMLHLNKDK